MHLYLLYSRTRILATETLLAHALIFAAVPLLATAFAINIHKDILSIAYTVQ